MTREEIQQRAEQARERLMRAASAVEMFIEQMRETDSAAAAGAALAHQEAIHHLNEALTLLNQVATRQSIAGDFPRCMRCDKPVDRLGLTPRPDDPGVFRVEYECHNEVVSQELPASAVEAGLSRYTAFNAYTSGLMPASPEERP